MFGYYGYGGGFAGFIGGIIVMAIIGGGLLLVGLVISNRAGLNISQVTDMSNITDVKGKFGQFKTLFSNLGGVGLNVLDEAKSRIPALSKVFTAKGMSVVSFVFMLLFAVIPLRFTWGFTRVNFDVFWFIQIIFFIAFIAALSKKYFQFFIVPIGTYFLLVFFGWVSRIIEYGKYVSSYSYYNDYSAVGEASREYWNFAGVIFLIAILSVAGMFFFTYFVKKFQETKFLTITCLASIPVVYLANCISYGGVFRSFLLAIDFSFWSYIAFVVGVVLLVSAKKQEEKAVTAGV